MILQNETTGLFTLHTRNTTYQMKVGDYRVLLHLYYGPRLEGDLSYLVRYADRSHSPNPNEAGDNRMFSLDVMPQEYSTCGVGDYRWSSPMAVILLICVIQAVKYVPENTNWRVCPPFMPQRTRQRLW